MKVVVLGGRGFVGKHLVAALNAKKHAVTSTSRRDGLDLTDTQQTLAYLGATKPDAIVNLAAHVGSLHYVTAYAADVFHDNVQIALNVYKAAVKSCPEATIINPLSNCSYPGDANKHYEPEWWSGEVHDSVFSYGNAKRFTYVISKNFNKQYKINTKNFV